MKDQWTAPQWDSDKLSAIVKTNNDDISNVDNDNEEIQALIDINEISSVVAASEWSHLQDRNTWASYTRKPECQKQWENQVFAAIEPIASDNPYQSVDLGEISALESVRFQQGSYGMDTRPKVFDNATQAWTLIDSGACVTCVPKEEGDVENPSYTLKSVNGGVIKTFGKAEVTLQMGRKTYKIDAVKADIPQKIFGWDLFAWFLIYQVWYFISNDIQWLNFWILFILNYGFCEILEKNCSEHL